MKKAALALLLAAAAHPAAADDFRPIFEEAFPLWVASSARLDICKSTHKTDDKIAAVLDKAGGTFFPGWLEWSARADFRKDMEFSANLAKAKGFAAWQSEGCFEIETLERIGFQTVEQVLEAVALFP